MFEWWRRVAFPSRTASITNSVPPGAGFPAAAILRVFARLAEFSSAAFRNPAA
jgi:hypothetical protein